MIEDIENLARELIDSLSFWLEDQGIGSYEYGGSRGVDRNIQPVCNKDCVEALLSFDEEQIPVRASTTHSLMGFKGDHEFIVDFLLDSVTTVKEGYIVSYKVTLR